MGETAKQIIDDILGRAENDYYFDALDILGNKTKEDSQLKATNEMVDFKTYSFPEMVKDRYFIMRVPDDGGYQNEDLDGPEDVHTPGIHSEGPHRAYDTLEEAVERAKWYCMKRKARGEVFRYIIVKSVATIEPESPPVEVTIFEKQDFVDND